MRRAGGGVRFHQLVFYRAYLAAARRRAGEWYPPTQPFPTKPPPYDRNGVAIDDLIDFTPELRAEAISKALSIDDCRLTIEKRLAVYRQSTIAHREGAVLS